MLSKASQTLPRLLPPDPVIEAYKKDVDVTLILAMRKLTPEERILSLQYSLEDLAEFQRGLRAAQARVRSGDKPA